MNGLSRCLGRQITQHAKTPFFRKCNTTPLRLSGVHLRRYSDQSSKYNGNMTTQPPKNEMVYMPGVMSPSRSFGVFRKVLHTGLYSQFVAMEVPVNGEIGDEIHTVDQVLIFTHGTGKAIVAGKEQEVKQNDVVIVPAGTQHQFLNIGNTPLEVVTIYSPAEHDPRTVHQTKAEGDAQEEAGEDEAPEWSQRSKSENEKIGLVKPP
ncbi:AraC-like ligand binding domain protein [Aspergillus costaricaensis CBS 115574]|uniref:AraC-like ligand binding domain protein n=1 Tax=Aspergillus costaricaensis CBS 115574 TaxID=1448317 RepID=A0ACD1IHB9_9EURO|nr:AraC-like ligand binding domain protein [Aspergillus costaricaensis CBS 115574]RAK89633.1 AraC-like ligand binding domain protein [Aspergillus costaricaensis CBS 115574]